MARKQSLVRHIVEDNWQQRAHNLVHAARDLLIGQPPSVSRPLSGSAYELLFAHYVRDLAHAKKLAEAWWDSVVRTETARTGDQAEAERILATRFRGGIAGHAAPVYVLRKYWLECAALGDTLPPGERIHPEDFLLSSLLGSHDDLARFLSKLPFWPIGMDEKGKWV